MNKVISLLENELNKGFLAGARRQLDWERSAIVDYDYVESDRQFAQKSGETERFSDSRDLSEEARKWSDVEPRFRFFLDGSRRTFRVADVPLGAKCLPILAGQVGVAVCERREKRMIAPSEYRTRYVLAVPQGLDKDGKTSVAHRAFFKSKLGAVNAELAARSPDASFCPYSNKRRRRSFRAKRRLYRLEREGARPVDARPSVARSSGRRSPRLRNARSRRDKSSAA